MFRAHNVLSFNEFNTKLTVGNISTFIFLERRYLKTSGLIFLPGSPIPSTSISGNKQFLDVYVYRNDPKFSDR